MAHWPSEASKTASRSTTTSGSTNVSNSSRSAWNRANDGTRAVEMPETWYAHVGGSVAASGARQAVSMMVCSCGTGPTDAASVDASSHPLTGHAHIASSPCGTQMAPMHCVIGITQPVVPISCSSSSSSSGSSGGVVIPAKEEEEGDARTSPALRASESKVAPWTSGVTALSHGARGSIEQNAPRASDDATPAAMAISTTLR
mmetsp:Transcript_26991/g.108022  ORF Transcript_26991/g.108022 Transcript_26991/m.108022 type:complete len:202 (-) Transcript_26991:617-1222(-)